MKKIFFLILLLIHNSSVSAKLILQEIHTSSNNVLAAFFMSDKVVATNYNQWIKEVVDVNEVETDDMSALKLNGKQPLAIHKFVTESSATCPEPKGCEHHIYLEIANRHRNTISRWYSQKYVNMIRYRFTFSGTLVPVNTQRQAHQNRNQDGQPFPLRDISDGESGCAKDALSGNPCPNPAVAFF
jgi:hypothetical protein